MESSVARWLKAKGYHDDTLIRGIFKAFPDQAPTIADLSSLGDQGLKALVEAVQREQQGAAARLQYTLDEVTVNINLPHSKEPLIVTATEGESFYELSQRIRDLGTQLVCSCRGIAACSTCHVYVDSEYVDKLPAPREDELDMLDLVWNPQSNSRLGCQIQFKKEVDGLTVTVPEHAHDLYGK
ncbi:2Fe-2S iron-sulfur cluster binding domain-containing protein [archaeon]|nr:MAG: 2Fe-2S iron-sulfur cluster binding domain-containing protein [archaeon]